MKIGLVVLSCDKYSDLWEAFFAMFFKHWPNCPFPVYLLSNEQDYHHPKVTTVKVGPDLSWSDSVKKCADQVDADYLMLFFDDVFLRKDVDPKKIAMLVQKLEKYEPDYLRFKATTKPDIKIDKEIGAYLEDTLYRTAVFAIWKKSVLMDVLKSGESAWSLETEGVVRTHKYKKFYGTYADTFAYWHGVEKGTWDADVVKKLESQGLAIDTNRRRLKTPEEMRRWRLALAKEIVFNRSPRSLRPVLLSLSRMVRRGLS